MAGKEISAEKQSAAFREVNIVALVLAALTLLEYFMAESETFNSPVFLFIVAFIKAVLVVYFFMHVYRLWRGDAH